LDDSLSSFTGRLEATLAQAAHLIWARRPTICHWPQFCPLTFRKSREIAGNCDVRDDVTDDVTDIGRIRTRTESPDMEANELLDDEKRWFLISI
jgi:hypothetical protein